MTFDEALAAQTARLGSRSLDDIEREVAQKRRDWVRARFPGGPARLTPREGFDLFCLEYLGLAPTDVPVVSESASEIVWVSRNPCPTLEACRRLGLDTREVCRAAYEKSTQALLSAADPALRFLRSYVEIRPHAAGCLERIVRVDFDGMMSLALDEAAQSRREGNEGHGAVVVLGTRVLARAHDLTATERDPGLHAGAIVLREAAGAQGDANLSGAILFSTCEPCSTCAALALRANLTAIAYGASAGEIARPGATSAPGSGQTLARAPVMVEVFPGVLADRCRAWYA